VDADTTVEAQIDALLSRIVDGDLSMHADSIERAFPVVKGETVRQALKIALLS